jgi:hypothetical protein
MKRTILPLLTLLISATLAFGGDSAKKQTIAYVQKLQTARGGFTTTPQAKVEPTLRATSAAVRALMYFGGEVPDKAACIKYVESCHDAASGGFRDTPNGKPDVFATAVGLMAVTELKMPTEKYAAGATKYLSEHAKGFDDIRIAVAGLERLHTKAPNAAAWTQEVLKLRNADGTFGKGAGVARDTGSCVVTLLRLGADVPMSKETIKILDAGQRQNGGWGKADSEIASDLETTYRVMRCYMMLKTQPKHTEGVRSFVLKCRNPDGGYGSAPGQPSNVNGTYFAAIVTHWLKE